MTHHGKSTLRPASHTLPDSGLAQRVASTSTALVTSHSFSSRSQEEAEMSRLSESVLPQPSGATCFMPDRGRC